MKNFGKRDLAHLVYKDNCTQEELEYYKDRYEMVCRINESQMGTISTYAQIMKLQEAELEKLRYEL